jgi:DNA-binding transcriptional ArsR family regulator
MRSRNATSPLDHIFYALSDPTRREILATLARGEANITRFAERSTLSFAAVAKHVKVLERGRLIKRKTDRLDRRAFVFELRPQPMQAGADWLEKHRQHWQARFAELEEFVKAHYLPRKDRADDSSRR